LITIARISDGFDVSSCAGLITHAALSIFANLSCKQFTRIPNIIIGILATLSVASNLATNTQGVFAIITINGLCHGRIGGPRRGASRGILLSFLLILLSFIFL
jgi:hypothetical protein